MLLFIILPLETTLFIYVTTHVKIYFVTKQNVFVAQFLNSQCVLNFETRKLTANMIVLGLALYFVLGLIDVSSVVS